MTDADPRLPALYISADESLKLAREGKAVYDSLDHIRQAPLSHLYSGFSSPLPHSQLPLCPW